MKFFKVLSGIVLMLSVICFTIGKELAAIYLVLLCIVDILIDIKIAYLCE